MAFSVWRENSKYIGGIVSIEPSPVQGPWLAFYFAYANSFAVGYDKLCFGFNFTVFSVHI